MGVLSFLFGGCDKQPHEPKDGRDKVVSKVQWFELEVAEGFRIGIVPDKPALISYKPTDSARGQTFIFLPETNRENYEFIFRSLDSLLEKLNIMDLPEHEPEKAFQGTPPRNVPAIHIRFVYGTKAWRSWYRTNEIPPKIQALYEGCRDLSINVCERGTKHTLAPEQAADIAGKRMGQ